MSPCRLLEALLVGLDEIGAHRIHGTQMALDLRERILLRGDWGGGDNRTGGQRDRRGGKGEGGNLPAYESKIYHAVIKIIPEIELLPRE